jgi:hypothetical protein
MDLLPNPADHRDRLAEIDLGVPGRMGQRHKGLAPTSPADPFINPSPPCSRRQNRAHREDARRSAWPCGAASPARSCPASRIASITGSKGPSFGFSAGFVRVYPGGRENRHIFAIVSRLRPKNTRRLATALALIEHKITYRRVHLISEHPPNPKGISLSTRHHKRRRFTGWFCHRPAQVRATIHIGLDAFLSNRFGQVHPRTGPARRRAAPLQPRRLTRVEHNLPRRASIGSQGAHACRVLAPTGAIVHKSQEGSRWKSDSREGGARAAGFDCRIHA